MIELLEAIVEWFKDNLVFVGTWIGIAGAVATIYGVFSNKSNSPAPITNTNGTIVSGSGNTANVARDTTTQNSHNSTTVHNNGLAADGVKVLLEAEAARWQGLTEKQAETIRAQERQLGVHAGAMQSFLAILNENNISPEQWPTKLQEIANRHNALLQQLQTLPKGNAETERLREAAEKAIAANRYDEADALLAQSLTLQAEKQTEGQLQLAATWASRGELSMTRLRYADAAQHFAQAANALPHDRKSEKISYLEQEANAWYSQGDEFGDNSALEKAIQRYTKLLEQYPRDTHPQEWAAIQNELGSMLWKLGERESGTEKLNKAIQTFQATLDERTRERTPLHWAKTQNNLGTTLSILGEREDSTEKLNEAVQAFREALKEQTQERVPVEWATTQNNLGTALLNLGLREREADYLNEAVQAYQKSLKGWTQESTPLEWATTQHNLGRVLEILGEREGNREERWKAAMTAYQNALKVAENAGAPYYVHGIQFSLQRLRAKLAEGEGGR